MVVARNVFKYSLVVLVAVLTASCLVGSSIAAASNPSGMEQLIKLPIEFSQPSMIEVDGVERVDVAECEQRIEGRLCPQVPYKTINVTLPLEARDVRLEVCGVSFKELALPAPLQVAKGPVPLSDPSLFTPLANPKFDESAWFPRDWAEMRVSGGRDLTDWSLKKFVTITVYPVRYLANEMRLQSLSSAEVKVSYSLERAELRSKGGGEKWDLLIISPEEFADSLGGLILHKNLMGLRTVLVTLEDAVANSNGYDDQAKLKYFISQCFLDHDVRFVLAIGDADKFPVRYADVWDNYDDYSNVTDGHLVPSDLYYADLYDAEGEFCTWDANENGVYGESSSRNPNPDQVDLMPDILFSRLPVGRTADLSLMVSHIINYELNVSDASPWFRNAILCGSVISGPDPEGAGACEQLASDIFSDYDTVKLYTTTTPFHRDGPLSDLSVIHYVSKGCGFVTYIGHGLYQGWAFGMGNYFFADDLSSLTNADMLPFVSTAACETAGFDNKNREHPEFPAARDCIGETFVRGVHGGAIAYVGATRVAYGAGFASSWNYYYAAKINRLILRAHKNGYRSVGEMFLKGVQGYINTWWSPSVYDMKTVMESITFGDPSLNIGGKLEALRQPVQVELSVPRFSYQHEIIALDVSCTNFEGARDVLVAIALVSPQGDMLFYPNWQSELSLVPFTLEAGFSIDDFELASFDTSLCPKGCNTFYIMLLDPDTMSPCSNLGGSCVYIQ